jgi:hypothetical protein
VSVSQSPAGTVILAGLCPVEDAEPLLNLFQSSPGALMDWTGLHTAVLQVVLAVQPALTGPCGDPWIAEWLAKR